MSGVRPQNPLSNKDVKDIKSVSVTGNPGTAAQTAANALTARRYSPLHDALIQKWNAFWDLPFDQLIQEVLAKKMSRIWMRMHYGVNYASKDDEVALKAWIEKLEAQEKKSGAEWAALGLCYARLFDFSSAIKNKMQTCFQKAADANDPTGLFQLALENENNKEVNERYLKEAAEQGSASAHYGLALKCFEKKEEVAGWKHMTIAEKANQVDSLYWLRKYYSDTKSNHYDSLKSREYLYRDIECGNSSTLEFLAECYLKSAYGFLQDIPRGLALYRQLGERQNNFCSGGAQKLFYRFLLSTEALNTQPDLVYHLMLLARLPRVMDMLEREEDINANSISDKIRNKVKHQLSELPLAFDDLINNNFLVFHELSNQEPWSNVAQLFPTVTIKNAQEILNRKISLMVDQVLAYERMMPPDVAWQTFIDYEGPHISYHPLVEKALKGSKDCLVKNYQTLFNLVEARIRALKAEIENQLLAYVGNDSKEAEKYRKERLLRVLNPGKDEKEMVLSSVDKLVKADLKLQSSYRELQVLAKFYGPLNPKIEKLDTQKRLQEVARVMLEINPPPAQSAKPAYFQSEHPSAKIFKLANALVKAYVPEGPKFTG